VKKLVSLVVLGAVVLAACGSGSNAVAATVEGQDVTVGDVESLIDTAGATLTKEQFAQFLAYQIQWLVIADVAESEYDIVFTDEEISTEADRIFEEVGEEGQSREDFLAANGVTEEFLQNIAQQGLIDIAIREVLKEEAAEPTAEEIDAAREEATASLTNVCASHILVATEAEADDVFTRLEEGEEFGALASELSTDTGSGAAEGALGCTAPNAYVVPFAEAIMVAPIGEVYDQAVQTEFGFHVILVTEREEPAEGDLPADEELVDTIKDEAILADLEEWFLSSVEAADVTVVEEYGTWQARPPTVVPPVDETTSTTISGTTPTTTE
jgi:foldase protein PrsA